jgi:hypothetical protein
VNKQLAPGSSKVYETQCYAAVLVALDCIAEKGRVQIIQSKIKTKAECQHMFTLQLVWLLLQQRGHNSDITPCPLLYVFYCTFGACPKNTDVANQVSAMLL